MAACGGCLSAVAAHKTRAAKVEEYGSMHDRDITLQYLTYRNVK
jgi:hypothetical protein